MQSTIALVQFLLAFAIENSRKTESEIQREIEKDADRKKESEKDEKNVQQGKDAEQYTAMHDEGRQQKKNCLKKLIEWERENQHDVAMHFFSGNIPVFQHLCSGVQNVKDAMNNGIEHTQ